MSTANFIWIRRNFASYRQADVRCVPGEPRVAIKQNRNVAYESCVDRVSTK